ncbi:MAG: penicillin-binding protein 2, partial [Pseudomonadales bacterium]|nr:penicillin-binding protein 2 [Pseudomonadales bacterium]
HVFLNTQGEARSVRTEKIIAYRGMILDRNDQPLAVSTPVVSIWVNPKEIEDIDQTVKRLAKPLELTERQLKQRLESNEGRGFVYLKRHLPPAAAEKILALEVAGVKAEKEYRRYYPAGEVAAHLVGFTDI